MSYILDALKRADAERSRGAVPGLSTPAQASPAPRHAPLTALALALLLGGLIAGVALWLWLRPAASTMQSSTQPPIIPLPEQPSYRIPDSGSRPVLPKEPSFTREQTASPGVSRKKLVPQPESDPLRLQRSESKTVPPPDSKTPQTQPPSNAAAERVIAAAELPPDARAALAKLTVNGVVYSDTPAQRMLVLAGQPYGEGANVAPGISVERIGAKNSVLKVQGQLVRLEH